MTQKLEYIVDLIFTKLKVYKSKEIFLEKENLKKFIKALYKEKWTREKDKKLNKIKIVIVSLILKIW